MATPQVPPRPARSTHAPAPGALSEASQIPQIPPRPTSRRHERSISPGRDRYAQSPLNAPFSAKPGSDNNPYHSTDKNTSISNLDLPQRPPSVTLPSIGQEGNEYESYSEYEAEPLSRTVSATQTSHVGTDLPMHAPKPGLSQSEATARVQTVTRSDNPTSSSTENRRWSTQLDDKDPQWRPLRSRGSLQLRSPSAAEHERPGSAQAEDHGIPQIGTQVPMYRFAGDVQAPSPAPQHTSGHESAGRPRHHNRTRSARDQSNPPDSYGRHGHGVFATDKFEKDWYAKHPEALAQEGHYSHTLHGNRADYVLSSEDLNKLVRESGKDAGFGTAPNIVGLPDEQIGYIASEEYASRMSSRPGSAYSGMPSPLPNQTKFDSLLQKLQPQEKGASPAAAELTKNMTGDSEVIHIDTPEHHWSKVTGEGTATPPVDLGPHGGNTAEHGGFIDEKGYGIPILASDEIRPESAWQRPAISPNPYTSPDLRNHFGSRPGSTSHSRPGSRPGSIHGISGLSRYISHEEHDVHTPLDDVEEYEPLFDDDKENPKPVTEAARLKHRPDIRHRFPSQDIWEDSPDSARLETEVDTPEPEEQEPAVPPTTSSSTFESPEAEAARKGEVTESDRAQLLSREERLAQSDFKPQIRQDLRRPGPHRFPSSDIWEDSPDSARLETTVGEMEDDNKAENPATAAGAIVNTTTDRDDLSGTTPRHGATAGEPVVPQRPARSLKHKSSQPKEHSHLSEVFTASSEDQQLPSAEVQRSTIETKKPPSIPARPKPQIPVRPNRSDAASPPETAPKTKPPVPAKPMGSKIAALQAGFMSDLNNRLKLGPQAPPKPAETEKSEPAEEEKAPLEDARKGRARGPARRKPATSPSAPAPAEGKKMPKLSFAKPITVWHISPKGTLDVVYEAPEPASEEPSKDQSTVVTEKAVDTSSDTDHSVIPTKSGETPSIIAPVTSQPDISLETEEMPGAFPTSTSTEDKSIGINPLPAVSGPGNPTTIPAGEPLPPHSQSINDKVTTDEASYENAGAGTVPPGLSDSQESELEPLHPVSSATQTGVKDVEINPNTPGAQKLVVIQGGNAKTGEDVVVQADTPKDDVGHVREDLVVPNEE